MGKAVDELHHRIQQRLGAVWPIGSALRKAAPIEPTLAEQAGIRPREAAPPAVAAEPVVQPEPPPVVAAPPASPAAPAAPKPAAIDRSIFRAYDIRGVVGQTLTAQVAQLIGQAVGSEVRAKGLQTVLVGRDGRRSGPELADADSGTGPPAKNCVLGGEVAVMVWLRGSTVSVNDCTALGSVPLLAVMVSG